jgi:hypothetical protein
MNTKTQTKIRPQLGTLAGVNERCELYGPAGANNLTVRKTYGKEGIRSLRCRGWGAEFSARKQAHGLVEHESIGGKSSERG